MSNTIKSIDLARDFSGKPFGRYPTDGDNSGERFRKEFVIPSLKSHEKVHINLTTHEGYSISSSFYMEAVALVIKEYPISYDELKSRLTLTSDADRYLIEEIWTESKRYEKDHLNDLALRMLAYPEDNYEYLAQRRMSWRAGLF